MNFKPQYLINFADAIVIDCDVKASEENLNLIIINNLMVTLDFDR
jgi:hypothetical protein